MYTGTLQSTRIRYLSLPNWCIVPDQVCDSDMMLRSYTYSVGPGSSYLTLSYWRLNVDSLGKMLLNDIITGSVRIFSSGRCWQIVSKQRFAYLSGLANGQVFHGPITYSRHDTSHVSQVV